MSDLLNCPFCGGGEVWRYTETKPGYDLLHVIECQSCSARINRQGRNSEDTWPCAIAAWNSRAKPAELVLLDDRTARYQQALIDITCEPQNFQDRGDQRDIDTFWRCLEIANAALSAAPLAPPATTIPTTDKGEAL